MNDVASINVNTNSVFLNTGSPHHVEMVEDLKNYNVAENGFLIRNKTYGKEGSNINFVEKVETNLTYFTIVKTGQQCQVFESK